MFEYQRIIVKKYYDKINCQIIINPSTSLTLPSGRTERGGFL